MKKHRLDDWLVAKGHYPSRARARDAILRGCIAMKGDLVPKPSRTVPDDDSVSINDPALKYVSRAALKLKHAISETGLNPSGKIALDLGASTGGFCQVLLENGAPHVYAIDVGHDQLAAPLRNNPSITNIENTNARELTLDKLNNQRPQFVTSDLSFISLKLALPPALDLAEAGAIGVFLVKPQFEVGKDGIGRGGMVRDPELGLEAATGIRDWLDASPNWRVTHFMPSPISGGDGNQEYLLTGVKNG